MEFLQTVLDLFLHLDQHLNEWAQVLGPWLYLLLFVIVFCETGLVVTPFLPGDSLLFAVGALCVDRGLPALAAADRGPADHGRGAGRRRQLRDRELPRPEVFTSEHARFLNREHLLRTHEFYERHGGKTIILARFVPIIRTFAPFVAGIGRMSYALLRRLQRHGRLRLGALASCSRATGSASSRS